MGKMQRTKGASGENEIAGVIRDITGWDVRRRCRQHDGDSDLVGVPGWSCESKRHITATRGEIAAWWRQTVAQATGVAAQCENGATGKFMALLPVLFFRANRGEWRAVWPVALHLGVQSAEMWSDYSWTVEGSVEAWAAVAREVQPWTTV